MGTEKLKAIATMVSQPKRRNVTATKNPPQLEVFENPYDPAKAEFVAKPYVAPKQRNERATAVAEELSNTMYCMGYDTDLVSTTMVDWRSPVFASNIRDKGFEVLGPTSYSGDDQPDDEVNIRFSDPDRTLITFKKINRPEQSASDGDMNARISAIADVLNRASDRDLVELMRNSTISDRLVHAFTEAKDMTKPAAPGASAEPEKRGRGRPRSVVADAVEVELSLRPSKSVDDQIARKRALTALRMRRYRERHSDGPK